jgi:hypothetical protein
MPPEPPLSDVCTVNVSTPEPYAAVFTVALFLTTIFDDVTDPVLRASVDPLNVAPPPGAAPLMLLTLSA